MNIKGTFCEGSQCKKRDKCALHCVGAGEYEYIDWSTYGGGRAWSDEEGTHVETWCDCGDNGDYKKFKPIVAYGSNQVYDRGFVLNSGHEPLIIQGTNWEHDISKEDFTQYDYVELNGVRFNRVKK